MDYLVVTDDGSPALGRVLLVKGLTFDIRRSVDLEVNSSWGFIDNSAVWFDAQRQWGDTLLIESKARQSKRLLDHFDTNDLRGFMNRFGQYRDKKFSSDKEMEEACWNMLLHHATTATVTAEESQRAFKEYVQMAKKPAAAEATTTTAPAAEGTTTAPAPESTKRAPPPREKAPEKMVVLKRMPKADAKEDHLPKQAVGILGVLEKGGGRLSESALTKAMEGTIETRQTMQKILAFYRKDLVTKGFVALEDLPAAAS